MWPDGRWVIPGDPPSADPSILPRLVQANRLPTRPSSTYDGQSFYNSGQFSGPRPPLGTAWPLTFDTPGTFPYVCIIHDGLGMVGSITVLPQE
jgi:hypothetical protein